MRSRPGFLALLLVLASTGASLLVLEAAFRIREHLTGYSPRAELLRYSNCFEKDPRRAFRLKADYEGLCLTEEFQYAIATNKRHMRDFRDPDHERPYNSGKTLVFALGDSFAFGAGVDLKSTFLSLAENSLADTSILKAGVPGYNVHQYLEYAKELAEGPAPDWVLVCVFTGNDLGLEMTRMGITPEGYLSRFHQTPGRTNLTLRANRFFFNKSALFRFLRKRGVDFNLAARLLSALEGETAVRENQTLSAPPPVLLHQPSQADPRVDALYRSFEQAMGRMRDILRARNIRMGVLLLPSRIQVEPEVMAGQRKAWCRELQPCRPDDFKQEIIQARMEAILKRLGIPFLNPLAAFQEEFMEKKTPLFWRSDGHFNLQGHLLLAEELTDWMSRDLGIAPKKKVMEKDPSGPAP